METNTEGLRVLVGGQPLTGEVLFAELPFGGTKTVVEVYRSGLRNYDFTGQPITLYLASACDDNIKATINLKPQFLKTCAPVEFHSSIKTFAVTPSLASYDLNLSFDMYDMLTISVCSTTLQIASYKPDNYLTTYTEYNTTEEGLKIELLYRKKGSTVWNKAYNSAGQPAVLLNIAKNSVVSV